MGIMDWFRHLAGDAPDHAAPAPAEEHSVEVGGLNFKSAVDAHMRWKTRLETYINGTNSEELVVDVVCRDDQCPLGKWIYTRGVSDFGYSETFFDMKAHHAHFHRCAGDVLRTAQAGDKVMALQLLHQGDYVRASERVKTLLAKLFVLVADGKTAIDAHMKWKERLHDHIAGRGSEPLDEHSITRDDLCALGQWIKGEGAKAFGGTPAFEHLCSVHTRFHAAAGHVVALNAIGHQAEALHMLEEGAYAQASDEVTVALVELFAKRG
ncbi:MAG: CZB domain-containing protein [Rhodocyclales bacterium]|nr:CZB domain-containing protein [Rhodocyclales bacterium]